MDWQCLPPFDSDIKIEEVQIEIKSEKDEREELTELIKAEIDVKFETYEQEENGTVRNENIEIKFEGNTQESLEHYLKEFDETQGVEETKNYPSSKNSSQNTWNCCLCDFEGKDKNDLKDHIISSHQVTSSFSLFKCNICHYTNKYLYKVVIHEAQHKRLPDAECHQPDAAVEQKIDLESNNQKCSLCDFKYNNKNDLGEHIKVAHKDPSNLNMFKCNVCNYLTTYFHKLVQHMSYHNSPSEGNGYPCDKCNYRSRYKIYLKQHALTHVTIPEADLHKCSMCPFGARSGSGLSRHLLTHKIQWYPCETCDHKPVYKSGKKSHILKHKESSKVKVYKCNMCEFYTRWKSSFNKHLSKHDSCSE
ncbi:zinc finger Y-chromosomal protein-like [Anoplophora glabripennis]|uniref:zinc finger Y-chromosomal protein-like n=1 Tax=Anoplophora glabripennis TaxID=217634 RepID=UPI000875123B|nr:zinc finger Y-chromosomal protein-like [Anoplophora glabripennis]